MNLIKGKKASSMRETIANGQLVRSEDAKGQAFTAFRTIAARVMLDGKPKDVVVKVRESAGRRFHYDLSKHMSGGARFRIKDRVPAQLQTASMEADTAKLNISDDTPEVNFSDAVAAMDQALSEASIKGKVTAEVIEGFSVAGRAAQGRYVAGSITIDPASPDQIGTARHEVILAPCKSVLARGSLSNFKLTHYRLFSGEQWNAIRRRNLGRFAATHRILRIPSDCVLGPGPAALRRILDMQAYGCV